ncbi:MAG: DinB family protein [Phycisphaerales bacterium]
MRTDFFICVTGAQFDAGLWMLDEILQSCPDAQWDASVGKYPFWHVAYHVLCFVDVYATVDNDAWIPDQRPDGMHPLGRVELDEEYPSRRFERGEMVAYLQRCRELIRAALAAETEASLAGPSGFAHLPFSRAELHLYNLRHLQHHTGQLSAVLRRVGVDTRWRKSGWGGDVRA